MPRQKVTPSRVKKATRTSAETIPKLNLEQEFRRMSQQYGPGKLLGETSPGKQLRSELKEINPSPKKSNLKRKAPEGAQAIEQSPSKRVAFNQQPNPSRAIYGELLEPNPAMQTLKHLHEKPYSMNVYALGNCVHALQDQLMGFAYIHYTNLDMTNFQIHSLIENHPSLFLTTQMILDGASSGHEEIPGWSKWFMLPEYRTFLVAAVVGEWILQRVFQISEFGLPQPIQKQLIEQVDQELCHFDAIVRAKARGKIVATALDPHNCSNTRSTTNEAIASLVSELSIVLAAFGSMSDLCIQDLTSILINATALHRSIQLKGSDGTVFVPALRIPNNAHQYHPDAPFRLANPSQMAAHMPRANTELNDNGAPIYNTHYPAVRLTILPRFDAFVPQALDIRELAETEAEARAARTTSRRQTKSDHRQNQENSNPQPPSFSPFMNHIDQGRGNLENGNAEDEFCWDCIDPHHLAIPILPEDLWRHAKECIDKEHMKRRIARSDRRYERIRARNALKIKQANATAHLAATSPDADPNPDDGASSGDDSPESSSFTSDGSDESSDSLTQADNGTGIGRRKCTRQPIDMFNTDSRVKPQRGASIAIFYGISSHYVYCEWLPLDAFDKDNGPHARERRERRTVHSLASTVARARRDLIAKHGLLGAGWEGWRCRLVDTLQEVAIGYRYHGKWLEWGLILMGLCIWGGKRMGVEEWGLEMVKFWKGMSGREGWKWVLEAAKEMKRDLSGFGVDTWKSGRNFIVRLSRALGREILATERLVWNIRD